MSSLLHNFGIIWRVMSNSCTDSKWANKGTAACTAQTSPSCCLQVRRCFYFITPPPPQLKNQVIQIYSTELRALSSVTNEDKLICKPEWDRPLPGWRPTPHLHKTSVYLLHLTARSYLSSLRATFGPVGGEMAFYPLISENMLWYQNKWHCHLMCEKIKQRHERCYREDGHSRVMASVLLQQLLHE